MNAAEQANFMAAHAVAEAEAFLGDRSDAVALGRAADRLMREGFLLPARAEDITTATRMLVITMQHASVATGARADRWRDVLKAFCRLVRQESFAMTEGQ